MRLAFNSVDYAWDDDGNLAGICLGYDYCAEHEWGVKGIKDTLGIWNGDPKTEKRVMGFDRVRVRVADNVQIFKYETKYLKTGNKRPSVGVVYAVALLSPNSWASAEKRLEYAQEFIDRHTFSFDRAPFNAAWDEKEFMIWGPESEKERLESIFMAFKNGSMLLGMHKEDNPFAGSSLFFGMSALYSEDDEKELIATQIAYREMWKRIDKTKIFDKLKKADCRFFACSPRQIQFEDLVGDESRSTKVTERQKKSKLPDIMFWLNPMEQQRNNSGWYTVEELEQWMRGEGPIPKL